MAISSTEPRQTPPGSSRSSRTWTSHRGPPVLVVEDIIDSGLTLSYLIRNLEPGTGDLEVLCPDDQAGPAEIGRARPHVGFEIPNRFRDRLRPGFRRAVQEPAFRGRTRPGVGAAKRLISS